jgi:ATP-dependent DNA ligase
LQQDGIALPVDSAVMDGEAVLMRPDNTFDFEGLRSRHVQAEGVLVAYDVMEVDGRDVRPERRETKRKPLPLARMLEDSTRVSKFQ